MVFLILWGKELEAEMVPSQYTSLVNYPLIRSGVGKSLLFVVYLLVTYGAPVNNSNPMATQVGHKTKPKATDLSSACTYKVIQINQLKKGKKWHLGRQKGRMS